MVISILCQLRIKEDGWKAHTTVVATEEWEFGKAKRLILHIILSLRDCLLPGYNFLFHSTCCKKKTWIVALDTSHETQSICLHSSNIHYNSFPNPITPKRHACSHQTLSSAFYSVHASISIVSSPSKAIPCGSKGTPRPRPASSSRLTSGPIAE